MLTRLYVSGFKNLLDVDVEFGAFTCIAGANGVGKSNLFDAIRFLSMIADKPLLEAATSVRAESGVASDVRNVFYHHGDSYMDEMTFRAEMIVSSEGVDDLGQEAEASITFLEYKLVLGYRVASTGSAGGLEIREESLRQINQREAPKHLKFKHSTAWRKSAVLGRRTSPFISTETEKGVRVIKLHQDGGSRGKPLSRRADTLPRTVLSASNAAESPTVVLAKREMQSWIMLQLEPSALRKPDPFNAPSRLSEDGEHLAATLNRLVNENGVEDGAVFSKIANRLADLITDVREISLERDEQRELLTLLVKDTSGTLHPAKSLSDGTLRFLALTVLESDPGFTGLLCLEEPENGIHPERIPAVLRLLRDISMDVDEPVSVDNPLRQVIVNTHSPSVVMEIPDESLLVADSVEVINHERRQKTVVFKALSRTWRTSGANEKFSISKGKLISYLNPVNVDRAKQIAAAHRTTRVVDRDDLQLMLPFKDR